jgi:hypothetical protein
VKKIFLTFWLVLCLASGVVIFAWGASQPHANCCLCMCHAKDETKCSKMCIRLQHSKRIIELPEMTACTKSCERVNVQVTDGH